jgi:hypothetical protein
MVMYVYDKSFDGVEMDLEDLKLTYSEYFQLNLKPPY